MLQFAEKKPVWHSLKWMLENSTQSYSTISRYCVKVYVSKEYIDIIVFSMISREVWLKENLIDLLYVSNHLNNLFSASVSKLHLKLFYFYLIDIKNYQSYSRHSLYIHTIRWNIECSLSRKISWLFIKGIFPGFCEASPQLKK